MEQDTASNHIEGKELIFLSSEFLRRELLDIIETIPAVRETCITHVLQGNPDRTISVNSGKCRLVISPGILGVTRTLQIVKSTLEEEIDILISSNPETKNGMFMYTKKAQSAIQNEHQEVFSSTNNPLAFYQIFSEAENLRSLAFTDSS